MPILTKPGGSWGQQKPPLGSQILQGHPLVRRLGSLALLNEGAGSTYADAVNAARVTTTSPAWAGAGASAGQWSAASTTDLDPSANGIFTCFSRFIVIASPASAYGTVYARSTYSSETANAGWGIGTRPTSNTVNNGGGCFAFYSQNNNGGPAYMLPSLTPYALGEWTIACTSDGTTRRIYVNGRLENSTTASPIPASCSTATVIGDSAYFRNIVTGYFPRALSASEVASLYRDPYQMVAPPAPWRFYSVPATVASGRIRSVLGSGVIGSGIVHGLSRRVE